MNKTDPEVTISIVPCQISIDKRKSATASTAAMTSTERRHSTRVAFRLRCLIFLAIVLAFYLNFYRISVAIDSQAPAAAAAAVAVSTFADIEQHSSGRHLLSVRQAESAPVHALKPAPNCTKPAIDDFPWDGLTRAQRQHGWVALHMLVAFYAFWFLAIICDDYFVPAIEQICEACHLPAESMGATIMAVALSSPELLINCIGTFVTEGNIGLGTVVGSSLFNVLAVPACCALYAARTVQLDWWPVTRDCGLYIMAVVALFCTLYDGRIMWYEALGLVLGYIVYMLIIANNNRLVRWAHKLKRSQTPRPYRQVNELTPLLWSKEHFKSGILETTFTASQLPADAATEADAKVSNALSPWHMDLDIYEYIFRWPITFLLWITVPNSRRHTKLKYLTLLLSVAWVALISYIVAYAITIIGDTLNIPDSVMGLTILAAGMSLTEAISSVLVTRQGMGSMGISNALSSNIFDILLCLGLPWFVKAYLMPTAPHEPWITLNSSGLIYATIFLLASVIALYAVFLTNRFVLNWKMGIPCLAMYMGFLILAVIIELHVFRTVKAATMCK